MAALENYENVCQAQAKPLKIGFKPSRPLVGLVLTLVWLMSPDCSSKVIFDKHRLLQWENSKIE